MSLSYTQKATSARSVIDVTSHAYGPFAANERKHESGIARRWMLLLSTILFTPKNGSKFTFTFNLAWLIHKKT